MSATPDTRAIGEGRLNGQTIISELIRNMELGGFEMAYSILLPCIFDVYLHPDDHSRLAGVLPLIVDDARRALRARVAELNRPRNGFAFTRARRNAKEYKIAASDWIIDFFPDSEGTVPQGDVEIHSELNETEAPGYRGMKTTLLGREPSVTAVRPHSVTRAISRADAVYAEIRYEDDSGPQTYAVTQNQVRIGRGGDDALMDLALYSSDEVSREHLVLRRDPATGRFYITDRSTNGASVNGRRLRKGVEEQLPDRAEIGVAEVLMLSFEARR